MASSILLGKHLRRQIRAKVWPALEEEGFVEFAPLRAHRVGEHTIDVVEFATFAPEWREPRWLGGEAYANGGTFTLHIGTYFRAADSLPGAVPPSRRPYAHECHRALRLAHESLDSAADGRTFWPGAKGERLDEVIDEALRVLRSRGLHHLREYGDCDAWLSAHEPGRTNGHHEEVGLSSAEATEMMRICREGRAARANALHDLHRQIHLADEHLAGPAPSEELRSAFQVSR